MERVQHLDRQVQRLSSRIVPNPTPRYSRRVIDYPLIDAGRRRAVRQAQAAAWLTRYQ